MKTSLSRALICTAFIAFASNVCTAATLLALGYDNKSIYQIDSNNLGSPTLIGYIGPYADLSTLVAVSADRLYTTERASSTLLTLDRNTGQVLNSVAFDRPIGTHPRGYDLSPGGILYGVIGSGGTGSTPLLYTINPLTGVTALVGTMTGAVGIEALAFAPDGTLYAAGSSTDYHPSDKLYRVNVSTGALTLVGGLSLPGGGTPDIDDLAWGSDGFLYGADSLTGVAADLYRINPSTAALAIAGNTGVLGLNGLAQAPVPIPAAAWLFGGALAVLAGMKRRTRQCVH